MMKFIEGSYVVGLMDDDANVDVLLTKTKFAGFAVPDVDFEVPTGRALDFGLWLMRQIPNAQVQGIARLVGGLLPQPS